MSFLMFLSIILFLTILVFWVAEEIRHPEPNDYYYRLPLWERVKSYFKREKMIYTKGRGDNYGKNDA